MAAARGPHARRSVTAWPGSDARGGH